MVMLGGLHIEMAAFKALDGWLDGSGWTDCLVQAGVAKVGMADSFLKASHITRTRHAHQVTAAALFILQNHAYEEYKTAASPDDMLDFDGWCLQQQQAIPQFKYWSLTLELILTILIFVRSLRKSDFGLYIDSLTQLAPWLSALDHTNYARYLPVHIRDMIGLESKHPEIANEFKAGKFTIQKSQRFFSAIAIDHAHEQNNAYVKWDGLAVALTENPGALRRWMLAGPEITRIIAEFEDQLTTEDVDETRHHEQQGAVQKTFFEQVTALVSYFEESGNPFLEASSDIISLDTKDIADSAMRKTVEKSNESVRSSLIHLLRRGSFTERRHCMTVYREISWYYLTVRIRRRNRKAKLSLPLPRMTLLYFPNYTSDVSIEVVMLMNSSNTRTKPFHHLCLTLENYDSLQNQIYLSVLRHLSLL